MYVFGSTLYSLKEKNMEAFIPHVLIFPKNRYFTQHLFYTFMQDTLFLKGFVHTYGQLYSNTNHKEFIIYMNSIAQTDSNETKLGLSYPSTLFIQKVQTMKIKATSSTEKVRREHQCQVYKVGLHGSIPHEQRIKVLCGWPCCTEV